MCDYCDGKGFYYVANGPDDSDKEVCDCEAGEMLTKDDPEVEEAINNHRDYPYGDGEGRQDASK